MQRTKKNKIRTAFECFEKELKAILEKAQKAIEAKIDAQIEPYKTNFHEYEKLVDRCFNENVKNIQNPNKDALIQQVNACRNLDELEKLLKEKANACLAGQDQNSKLAEIKEEFACYDNYFEKPTLACCLTDGSPTNNVVSQITNRLRSTIEPVVSQALRQMPTKVLDGVVKNWKDFATEMSSKIITDDTQKSTLKGFFNEPNQSVEGFRLLYRASKDGFGVSNFHRLCDDHGPTITIVKSESGKVFGGYTDVNWSQLGAYVNSQKAWLFSVDRKEKYPVKQANAGNSTYCGTNYGPTFGGGHDLYISTNSNTVLSSYSSLGYSFGLGTVPATEKQTALAGSYQFKTAEIEVYEILYK